MPAHAVTAGTTRTAEEQGTAALGVTCDGNGLVLALQNAQVCDDSAYLGIVQRRPESGHAGGRDTGAYDMRNIAIGKSLYLGLGGDVRRMLPAPAIKTMAGCARRAE